MCRARPGHYQIVRIHTITKLDTTSRNMGISTQTHTSGACRAITPADGADFDALGVCRAIYVGGTGDISIDDIGGETIVFVGVQGGSVLPVQTSIVNATGTTATNLVALY